MKNFLTASLFLMIAGGACSAQSEPQSLGEVAKQNKQDKKAVLVITEDDISSSPGVVSVVGDESVKVADAGPASPQKAAADVDKAKAAPSDSSPQVAELKKQLDAYKAEREGWKQSAKHYEELLATETSDFRRATYESALANDKVNVTLSQQKIDDVQAQIAKTEQTAGQGEKHPAETSAPGDKQP